MNFNEKAKTLIEIVGGDKNIIEVVNCMTRVRFTLKDYELIKKDELQKYDWILGTNLIEGQYQIIVGPGNAGKIVTEVTDNNLVNNVISDEEILENKKKYKKNVKGSNFTRKLGEIFIPMIPGFIAAGLLLGIANILINFDVSAIMAENPSFTADEAKALATSTAGPIYWFCQTLGIALYGYLVLFTGTNTAKAFGGTEILGGIIAAFTISSTLPNIILSTIDTFSVEPGNIPSNIVDFSNSFASFGGVFGAMFSVMFMCYIEKKVRKVMPGILDLIVSPLITLILAGLGSFVLILGAGLLTQVISAILNFLVGTSGIVSIISGGIIAGTFLPLVLLGLHQGLTPIYIQEIVENGATYILPIAAMAGAGQVGAAFSIYLQARKLKVTKMTNTITGAIIPGILGVGEPLIYGVTLPLGKPFITAGLGAAVGGAWIAFSKVGAVATGPSGITLIPLILPEDILQYIVGILLAYVFGFLFTQLLFKYQGDENRL